MKFIYLEVDTTKCLMPVLGRNIHLTYQTIRVDPVLKYKPLAGNCEVCIRVKDSQEGNNKFYT